MWESMVKPGRPQMTVWSMRFAHWITLATDRQRTRLSFFFMRTLLILCNMLNKPTRLLVGRMMLMLMLMLVFIDRVQELHWVRKNRSCLFVLCFRYICVVDLKCSKYLVFQFILRTLQMWRDYHRMQWRTGGGSTPPPKFRSFDIVEPDCKLSGKCLVFLFQHPN